VWWRKAIDASSTHPAGGQSPQTRTTNCSETDHDHIVRIRFEAIGLHIRSTPLGFSSSQIVTQRHVATTLRQVNSQEGPEVHDARYLGGFEAVGPHAHAGLPTPHFQSSIGNHRLDVYIDNDARLPAFAADLSSGLSSTPKRVPTKWLYDELGGQLFGKITKTHDYYISRAETNIIQTHKSGIAALATAETFVDLGSGYSNRTAIILDAMMTRGAVRTYVPFEIDGVTLKETAAAVVRDFPTASVHAIVGDFDAHLPAITRSGRQLVGLLGQTYGNFPPRERSDFLQSLHASLAPGDTFMLGIDLIKDPDRLKRAYNDSEGATAAFVKNILGSINRLFDGTFDPDAFTYLSEWNEQDKAVEMVLRSNKAQTVELSALDMTVKFAADEDLHVGRSRKFERQGLEKELAEGGFKMDAFITDSRGDYALVLANRI
jgi:L-histidine Nalpha-methyltransferase